MVQEKAGQVMGELCKYVESAFPTRKMQMMYSESNLKVQK